MVNPDVACQEAIRPSDPPSVTPLQKQFNY